MVTTNDSNKSKKPGNKKGQKLNVSPKGRKVRSEMGRKNLQNWKDRTPGQGKITHGAQSQTIRQRYSDKRTREGKVLQEVLDGLISDLGGPSQLTTGHQVLLSSIKSKLIVIMQISGYIDRAESLIDKDGNLLPVLSRGFTTYAESLRRDIECLFGIKRGKPQQSYATALKALDGGKN